MHTQACFGAPFAVPRVSVPISWHGGTIVTELLRPCLSPWHYLSVALKKTWLKALASMPDFVGPITLNVIFQDIQAAPTQGVELLCKPVVATVSEVNLEDCSIILSSLHSSWNLDRPVMEAVGVERYLLGSWLLMALNKGPQFLSWITKGQPLSLLRSSLKLGVHGGNDMMTSRQSAGILSCSSPKTSCLEVVCLGSLLTLKLWEVVWLAKRPPPLQGWTACPSKIWEPCPIVCLKIYAESLLLQNQVGCGQHKWFGRVTCLAKSDSPQSASDFRPITVLGLIYSCYGTFHARHAARVMEDVLPEHLYGSGVGEGLC